ncbi:MAG: type VI secretion lipoprotein TssJ [Planctomycetes bacterium]|nr:type VI secretion lipoprotein TssJ [Planctomycetota bacterium]
MFLTHRQIAFRSIAEVLFGGAMLACCLSGCSLRYDDDWNGKLRAEAEYRQAYESANAAGMAVPGGREEFASAAADLAAEQAWEAAEQSSRAAALSFGQGGLDSENADTAAIADANLAAERAADHAAAAAEAASIAAARDAPTPRSFFGLRLDDSKRSDMSRRYQVQSAAHAPISVTEKRLMRAELLVERESRNSMGAIYVKPDGAASKPGEVKFVPAANALSIAFRADERLNSVDGVPHALVLTIYQMQSEYEFARLTESPDTMISLMEGERFDRSVRAVKQIHIQPGENGVISLDRPDRCRWVAIVAGYSHMRPGESTFLAEYPIGYYPVKPYVYNKTTMMYAAQPMALIIDLSESAMTVYQERDRNQNFRKAVPLPEEPALAYSNPFR